MIPRLVLTSGEPAGVGPDLIVRLATQGGPAERVAIGDPELFRSRAATLGVKLRIEPWCAGSAPVAADGARLPVLPVPLAAPAIPGRLDPANSGYVVETLHRACSLCLSGEFDAMVTAPVQKSVINDAGIPFSGHTEFLAELTGSPQPVMMLVAGGLRVALLTTHLPLREVPKHVTCEKLDRVVRVMHDGLERLFGIRAPQIAVLGLNPHAGESGHLGTEERDVIEPALEALRADGILAIGPLPADSAFTPARLARFDAVLAMYHDQGLPVLKHAGFGESVNITLGLPIIRTSVDHGTALELAGSGRADPGSLWAAIRLADELVRRRA